MLGKRPHQIQRTTSMSQLRAPPSARIRAPCTSDFAHGRKQPPSEIVHARMDCTSLKGTINQGSYSGKTAAPTAAGEYTMKPKVLGDNAEAQVVETVRISNTVLNGSALPQYTAQKQAHNAPIQVVCSSTANSFHAVMAESFLEACYFCERPLGHGRDIFMYRGDAAFCTEECRLRQMSSDEVRGQKCSALASQGPSTDDEYKNHNPKSGN